MAWTTPRDWTSGELVTHTIMNTHIRDNFEALKLHTHSGSDGDGSSALNNVDTITYDHQGQTLQHQHQVIQLYIQNLMACITGRMVVLLLG